MPATNYGQNWPAWSSADGTLGTSIATGANSTSAAYNNYVASPSEVLNTRFNLVFTYPNNAPTGTVTINILAGTQAGYQASTDPGVYSFTFTPTQNATNNYDFTIPGDEIDQFKVNVVNNSGFTMTSISLYNKQSQGQFG